MDLGFVRGDIEELRLDPIRRAQLIGERADRIEARREEEERQARREAREARLIMDEAIERQQIATQGYSDRELAEVQRAREAARLERIDELESELDRLDPRRRAARAAETRRMGQVAAMDRALSQARAIHADGFMRRQVEAWHVREIARKSGGRQAEITRLGRAVG